MVKVNHGFDHYAVFLDRRQNAALPRLDSHTYEMVRMGRSRIHNRVEHSRRWKALVGNIHLSDSGLRDFEGSPVSDQEAKAVFRAAVDKAFVLALQRVSS